MRCGACTGIEEGKDVHDGLGRQLIKARGPISRRVIVERQRALFVSVHLGSSRVVLSDAIIFIELCEARNDQ